MSLEWLPFRPPSFQCGAKVIGNLPFPNLAAGIGRDHVDLVNPSVAGDAQPGNRWPSAATGA